MSAASLHPLSNPEVVANLRVYVDEARVAGKANVLEGSDRKTLDLLKRLSATDFLSAEWMPIPGTFEVIGPDGERLRCAQLSVLSN